LAWDRSNVLLGVVYALPASVVVFNDLPRGLSLAVGVVPAAAAGLAPTRRARRATAALGLLVGVPILLGSVLATSRGSPSSHCSGSPSAPFSSSGVAVASRRCS
jgi:hypothetical protein